LKFFLFFFSLSLFWVVLSYLGALPADTRALTLLAIRPDLVASAFLGRFNPDTDFS
jgi:hypothetical protein